MVNWQTDCKREREQPSNMSPIAGARRLSDFHAQTNQPPNAHM